MITSQFCGGGNRSTLSSSLDGTPVTTPVTGGRFPPSSSYGDQVVC